MFLFLYILLYYDVILLLHRALYTWCSQICFVSFFLFFPNCLFVFCLYSPPPSSILFPRKKSYTIIIIIIGRFFCSQRFVSRVFGLYNIISFHRQAPRRSSIDHGIIDIRVQLAIIHIFKRLSWQPIIGLNSPEKIKP